MKHDDTARPHEPCSAFHHCRGVRIEHENVSADSRVKFLGELQAIQISMMKRYVALSERADASLSGGHGGRGNIDAPAPPPLPADLRHPQRRCPPAAADIQHPHALLDTCVPIILPSKGIYEFGL